MTPEPLWTTDNELEHLAQRLTELERRLDERPIKTERIPYGAYKGRIARAVVYGGVLELLWTLEKPYGLETYRATDTLILDTRQTSGSDMARWNELRGATTPRIAWANELTNQFAVVYIGRRGEITGYASLPQEQG